MIPRLFLYMMVLALLPGAFSSSVERETSVLPANGPHILTETQSSSDPVARFTFDGTVASSVTPGFEGTTGRRPAYVDGLEGQALQFGDGIRSSALSFAKDRLPLDGGLDFSVQFWIRTEAPADRRFVMASQKPFPDNSLASQKESGWVFYMSGGSWAWNMGSGSRRITYERDNGQHMPLNDGRWHQLTMTFSRTRSEVRLFFDGVNWVSYHVSDSDGFDFSNEHPLVVGWDGSEGGAQATIPPKIELGAEQLQELVDAFSSFELGDLAPDDLIHLVVDPRRLFEERVEAAARTRGADSLAFREAMAAVDWEPISAAKSSLMSNPYTVHQNLNFTGTAPLTKVYSLVDGRVVIQSDGAESIAQKERLYDPAFEMDNLSMWDRVLNHDEVLTSYADFFEPLGAELEENLQALNAASWNIWHGGKHWTVDEHGWDSRVAIADMIRDEAVDVVMMQETYSSGDFIAAELGYYFATTVDWDYLNQGSNISVLSRFPILDLHVQEDSPFQNVGVKVAISRSQDMYVMSNWYGMGQFPAVFDFHSTRFLESDSIPTLFAGDFNAVPHTDGGDSPASVALLDAGFTDAFRDLYPDAQAHPGPSHRNGRRIDQLYYKGAGLTNTSTRVILTRPGGFPSDHFLILSTFDLDYSTRGGGR